MSNEIFYKMKKSLILNKVSSATSVLSKSIIYEKVKKKLSSDIKERKLVDFLRSSFSTRTFKNIIYDSIASEGLSKNRSNLLSTNNEDDFVYSFLKHDFDKAKESWGKLISKIDSSDKDFYSSWTGVALGYRNKKESKTHKLYYSFRFSRGNLQNGVKLFGNTVIQILKLLVLEIKEKNISYFSFKIPTDFFEALKHSDILVIHFSSEKDALYAKEKVDQKMDYVYESMKDQEFVKEKGIEGFDSSVDFGEFKKNEDRRRFTLRPGYGHDVVGSDSDDFSGLLAVKITKLENFYSKTLNDMAEYIDSNNEFDKEDIRIADAISMISSFLAMSISNELMIWKDMSFDEKREYLKEHGIESKVDRIKL